MIKAAGYTRVSTTGQALTGESLKIQREAIEQYCGAYGLELVEVFEDAGISGANGERPAFNAMVRDAIAGRFKTIVVYDISRAGRDLRDFLEVIHRLDGHGVTMVCIKERIDSADRGTGRLILNVLASVANWELEKIKERVEGGINAKRHDARGPQVYMGSEPYGYRWKKQEARFEVVEEEADVYRWVVRMYLDEALSIKAIAKRLREAGVKNRLRRKKKPGTALEPKPKAHSANTVNNMLRNPAYTGQMVANQWKYKKRGKQARRTGEMKPKPEWVFYTLPALVDRPTWERIQARIDASVVRSKRAEKTAGFWLRDVLRCGLCGRVVKPRVARSGAKSNYRVYLYYVCVCKNAGKLALEEWGVERCTLPSMLKEEIEAMVWRKVVELYTFTHAGREENIGPAVETDRWDERIKELTGRVQKHQRALTGKKAAKKYLYDMLEDPDLVEEDIVDFKNQMTRVRGEIGVITGHLRAAEEELAGLKAAKEDDALYRDFMENERGTLEALARQLALLGEDDRKMLVDAMLGGEYLKVVTDGEGWNVTGMNKLRVNIGAIKTLVEAGKLGALAANYHPKQGALGRLV